VEFFEKLCLCWFLWVDKLVLFWLKIAVLFLTVLCPSSEFLDLYSSLPTYIFSTCTCFCRIFSVSLPYSFAFYLGLIWVARMALEERTDTCSFICSLDFWDDDMNGFRVGKRFGLNPGFKL